MKTEVKSPELSSRETRTIHIMQLLGDKTRYKIFKLLMNNEEICVSDIAHQLNISVSAVSQHFRSFEMIGLVDKERMGQRICYSIKTEDAFVKQLTTLTKEK